MMTWAYAIALSRARADVAEQAWRKAVDEELASTGVMRRVLAANAAIDTDAFRAAFVADEARRAAKDENDLRAVAERALGALGVDLTDVSVRCWRAREKQLRMHLRLHGGAQVRLRAGPSVAAATRALEAARLKGYPIPGSLTTSAGGAEQTLQGTSEG